MAIKVIRADLAADPDFRARFAREVAAAQTVSGLFTAQVVDADPGAAVPWLATAFVAGPSLAEAVTGNGPLRAPTVVALAAALAEGLGAIHEAGLVHRDLKPTNVLLAHDGPRIIDFGISRAAEASALTGTGLVVGSPGFMSPEQASGDEVGPASDIFSLGAVIAFAATGDGPFGTGSVPALLYRVVHNPPAISGVHTQIRPLVERCLAKDPAQRPSAREVLEDLGPPDAEVEWLPEAVADASPGHVAPAGISGGAPVAEDAAARPPTEVANLASGVPAAFVGPATATGMAQNRALAAHLAERPAPGGPGDAATIAPGPPPRRHASRRLAWAAAGLVGGLLAAAAVVTLARGELTSAQSSQRGHAKVAAVSSSSLAPSSAGASPTASSDMPTPTTSSVTPSPTASAGTSSPASSSRPQAKALPQITSEATYQKGQLVYFKVYYSDAGHDAEGFGFVGVNGARWAEENHPFSSPSYGIVGSGWVAYPFNLACGTSRQIQSDVQAWIYDTAGTRSGAVTIHLACTAPAVPQITSEATYQKGQLVYFKVYYSDAGHDAEGFGFVGVNGARWAEENHPFSSPSYGIVGSGWVAYPFNLACGTSRQIQSDVQAWIYDTAGTRSGAVTIHLACTN